LKGTVGGIVAAARAPGENANDVSLCVHCCQVRSFLYQNSTSVPANAAGTY
jgi:hypothetical protein